MQIQINTDSNIEGHDRFVAHAKGVVESALGRFTGQVTRVEVHVSDQSSDKQGEESHGHNSVRCVMEARLEGRRPTAVSDDAETVEQAVQGAAGKLKRSIESTLGRLHDQR